MKRLFWMGFLVVLFAFFGFSEGLLGLRTVEPTPTAVSTPTEQATGTEQAVGVLSLRTIDPLLSSFRDGWKVPNLPGWSTQKAGDFSFKVPANFSVSSSKSGANIDGELKDAQGKRFAWLFVYQLESYGVEELLDAVVASLYADRATSEKDFEEFQELGDGKVAYFTRLGMKDQKMSFPVLLLYSAGEKPEEVESGTVVMLFFEPVEYLREDQQQALQGWIEGIGGSWIGAFSAPPEEVKQPTPPKVQEPVAPKPSRKQADLGSLLVDAVSMDDWVTSLPRGWEEEVAYTFQMYYPEYMVPEYFYDDAFEGFDFGYGEITVAKVFVGDTGDEWFLADDVFDELYESYLSGLGSYDLVKETPYFDEDMGFLKVYEMDFDEYKGWIAIFSESEYTDEVAGEFILFVGISPYDEVDSWAQTYRTMLMSIQF
ncbi:MAG TPA: hypothetical protein PLF96_07580 [Thermotogota bacterium]|nr:hypothetical protein [Thermotogota bacterium]